MDYYYNVTRDTAFNAPKNSILNTASRGPKDMNGFQFRRINVTFDYDFSKNFTSRFRLETDGTQLTTDGKKFADNGNFAPFVKDAYIKWKGIFEGSDAIAGMQFTPGYEISEMFWGFRSLEKTQMDLRGILPSRDIGVSLRGKIINDGLFNYVVMYGNGSNVQPETDRYKRIYGSLYSNPIKNLHVTLYGDYKYQKDDLTSSIENNALTTSLFVGYTEKDACTFGVEAFLNSKANSYFKPTADALLKDTTSLKAYGLSVFGRVNITSDFTLLARYDFYEPNNDSDAKGDSRNFILAGLSWSPEKGIQIIPNITYETYEKITAVTVGTPKPAQTFKSSLTARVTFVYNY